MKPNAWPCVKKRWPTPPIRFIAPPISKVCCSRRSPNSGALPGETGSACSWDSAAPIGPAAAARKEIANMQQLAATIRAHLDPLVDGYDARLRSSAGYDRLPEALRRELERHVLHVLAQCLEHG